MNNAFGGNGKKYLENKYVEKIERVQKSSHKMGAQPEISYICQYYKIEEKEAIRSCYMNAYIEVEKKRLTLMKTVIFKGTQ